MILGALAEFVGELAGQRRCLCTGLQTGLPDRRCQSAERELRPVSFGDRDRHEKAEKNDDDDRLLDRTASF